MLNRTVHPGVHLKEAIADFGMSISEFARQIDVTTNRITMIVNGQRSITGDTALRLGHWFGQNPQFWMNLQAHHDLVVAKQAAGTAIEKLPTAPVQA